MAKKDNIVQEDEKEYISSIKKMYDEDMERVLNGERALFFGHLNDKPLENKYPEFDVLAPSYLKLLKGVNVPAYEKYGITTKDVSEGAINTIGSILNLPRTIGNVFRKVGSGMGDLLGDGTASKVWKASIGKWMTYFGRYPERMPAFIDASEDMEREEDIVSFSDAFSKADKDGLDEFEWKGKKYKVEKKKEGGSVISKQRKAYDYFINKRGMSQIQALAILGNLMAESGLVDNVYGDNNTSYGIQQWHNERKDALFKYAKKKGHKEPTFEDQIEFLADEYEGKAGYSNFLYKRKGKDGPGYYNYSLQDFQSAESLRDAVIAWNQGAGRPHKSVIRNDDRYNEALNVAKNIGVEVDVSAPSLYGQMGYKDSVSPIPENTVIKEGIIEGKTANESATSSVENPEDEAMGKWVDTYGKDIIAQLMSMNGKDVSQSPEETGFDYKQYVKDEEEDKRKAIIQAVLPNIQLKIKGVTEVGE